MKKGKFIVFLLLLIASGYSEAEFVHDKFQVKTILTVERYDRNENTWAWIDGFSLKKGDIFKVWVHGIIVIQSFINCSSFIARADAVKGVTGRWRMPDLECADDIVKIYEGLKTK